mgnify:CR=1 FL=1
MMERQEKLIKILIKSFPTPISREDLGKALDVSVSTIRDDIQSINSELKKEGCEIILKRGMGVRLNKDSNRILNQLCEWNTGENTDYRSEKIILFLLQNLSRRVSYKTLENQFSISDSSLRRNIMQIKDILAREYQSVKLSTSNGILIQGDEEELRKLLSNTLVKVGKINDLYGFKSSYKTIEKVVLESFKLNISFIQKKLKELCQKNHLYLSDVSFNAIIFHIAISIYRLQQNCSLKRTFLPHEESSNYNEIKNFCISIFEYYHVPFNENEMDLIYQQISNSSLNEFDLSNQQTDTFKDAEKIAKEIIKLVEEYKQIEVTSEVIKNTLILHILPTISRLKTNEYLKNPILNTIKSEYPDVFGLAWMSNKFFENYLGEKINEDEIGYLAIHIQTMIEQFQSKNAIKTIIVCSQGIGVSQFLMIKLSTYFRDELSVVGAISESDLNYEIIENADLIISTYSIQSFKENIVVSPLLNKDDIERIEIFIQNFTNKNFNFFTPENLKYSIKSTLKKQDEIIDMVEKELVGLGYVGKDFKNAILQREKVCSTSVGNRIAIPHADMKIVKKSVLYLVTTEKPIVWGSDEVNIVLFVVLNSNDSKKYMEHLKNIYRNLYLESFQKKLFQINDEKELFQLINQ